MIADLALDIDLGLFRLWTGYKYSSGSSEGKAFVDFSIIIPPELTNEIKKRQRALWGEEKSSESTMTIHSARSAIKCLLFPDLCSGLPSFGGETSFGPPMSEIRSGKEVIEVALGQEDFSTASGAGQFTKKVEEIEKVIEEMTSIHIPLLGSDYLDRSG